MDECGRLEARLFDVLKLRSLSTETSASSNAEGRQRYAYGHKFVSSNLNCTTQDPEETRLTHSAGQVVSSPLSDSAPLEVLLADEMAVGALGQRMT